MSLLIIEIIIVEIPSSNFSVFGLPLNLDSSLLLQVTANMFIHLKILKKSIKDNGQPIVKAPTLCV